MAWHKKGLSKEDKKYCDFLVAKALVDIVTLDTKTDNTLDDHTKLSLTLEALKLITMKFIGEDDEMLFPQK